MALDKKLLQVESDEEKPLTKHTIVELDGERRTTWTVICPLCKADATQVKFFGGLVTPDKQPREEQPASLKPSFLLVRTTTILLCSLVARMASAEGWPGFISWTK